MVRIDDFVDKTHISFLSVLFVHFILCALTMKAFLFWGSMCVCLICWLTFGFRICCMGDAFVCVAGGMIAICAMLNWNIFMAWCGIIVASLCCFMIGFRTKIGGGPIAFYCLCLNEIVCAVFVPEYGFWRTFMYVVEMLCCVLYDKVKWWWGVIIYCVALWLSFTSHIFCVIGTIYVVFGYTILFRDHIHHST